MCYRYKVTGVAFASFVSIAVFSPVVTAESELYVTGGVSSFDLGGADPTAATFRGGLTWNETFGAEIEGSFGIDEHDYAAADIQLDVDGQVAAYLVGRLPVGEKGSVFARIGYSRTDIEGTAQGQSNVVRTDGIAYGAGGELMLTDRFGIRADYTRLTGEEDTLAKATDVFSLSGVVKFGGSN